MKKFRFNFSILKLPKHQRFNYVPLFYDPVTEDLNNRIALAESRLRQEEKIAQKDPEAAALYRERISSAYTQRRRRLQQTSLIRMIIVLVLTLVCLFFWVV